MVIFMKTLQVRYMGRVPRTQKVLEEHNDDHDIIMNIHRHGLLLTGDGQRIYHRLLRRLDGVYGCVFTKEAHVCIVQWCLAFHRIWVFSIVINDVTSGRSSSYSILVKCQMHIKLKIHICSTYSIASRYSMCIIRRL
jgi:hypothetical protein